MIYAVDGLMATIGGQLILCSDQTLAVRHAVSAGVVAGGGQADPQIAEAPALAVDDHAWLRRGSSIQYIPALARHPVA